MTTDIKRGSSFKLWDQRLDGDMLTRGQIRQLCNAVAAGGFGYMIGGHHTNLTHDDARVLMDKFGARCREGGYKLERDHEQAGLEWLWSYGRNVGITPTMLEDFDSFRLVGVVIAKDGPVRAHIVPRYRVLFKNGSWVEYSWSPWQDKAYG